MEDCTQGVSQDQGEEEAGTLGRYGRRALIFGAGAAGAGLAATLAAGADPAAAANDSPVELGESNTASATTSITTTTGNGLNGLTTSDETYACGVLGESQYGIGVYGTQSSTSGLLGGSVGSEGVPSTAAVVGDTGSASGVGVMGLGSLGGVSGWSTEGYGVAGISESFGVLGIVSGDSSGQYAISGNDQTTGTGGGYGVAGFSEHGTGVFASGPVALEAEGVAKFSRSGIATVAGTATDPAKSVTVTGMALTSSSMILATPQGIVSKVAVEGVVPNVSGSSFEIHLTKAITVSLAIAWFVVG